MGLIVNETDPLYKRDEYVYKGFTNQGMIIKLVHNTDL